MADKLGKEIMITFLYFLDGAIAYNLGGVNLVFLLLIFMVAAWCIVIMYIFGKPRKNERTQGVPNLELNESFVN